MTFDNWFYEIDEGAFYQRSGLFYEDILQWMLDYQEDPDIMANKVKLWLEAAYEQGYKDGEAKRTNSGGAPATESRDSAPDSLP